MTAITIAQMQQYVAPFKNSKLVRREGLHLRFDELLSFLPKVKLPRTEIQTNYIKSQEATMAFPSTEGEDVGEIKFVFYDQSTQNDPSLLQPLSLQSYKFTIDINIDKQSVRSMGPGAVQGLLDAATKEVEYLACAALFYGRRTDSGGTTLQPAWTSWPFNDTSGAAYNPVQGPKGLFELADKSTTGLTVDAAGAALSLDEIERIFTEGEMPQRRATCLVMNSDMLSAYNKLWFPDGSAVNATESIAHPLTGEIVPARHRIPILQSNFLATCDGSGGNEQHPDYTGLDQTNSSIFALHVDHKDPLNGLCLFHPDDNDQLIVTERRDRKDAKDEVSYRISLEFGLHVSTNIDVVRLAKVNCGTSTIA